MKISAYRKSKNLTLAAFAAKLGCSEAALSRYENGQRIPEGETMQRIFDATDGAVTPNDFYDLTEQPSEPPADAPPPKHAVGQ